MRAASSALGFAALCLGLAAPEAEAQGGRRPLALVSGDFDEDGAPELITAYGASGGGVLAVQRRKPGPLLASPPEARTRPGHSFAADAFLPATSVVALPLAPELLGTGDFDGDGHL